MKREFHIRRNCTILFILLIPCCLIGQTVPSEKAKMADSIFTPVNETTQPAVVSFYWKNRNVKILKNADGSEKRDAEGYVVKSDFYPILLALWPDGKLVWSKNQKYGGAPYIETQVDPSVVSKIMDQLSSASMFTSAFSTHAAYKPSSSHTSIAILHGNQNIYIQAEEAIAFKTENDYLPPHWDEFSKYFVAVKDIIYNNLPRPEDGPISQARYKFGKVKTNDHSDVQVVIERRVR